MARVKKTNTYLPGVNYNPRVEINAKGYKFYMSLYSEIFQNLLGAKHKNCGYQS